jgi:hypothetical protein
MPHGFGYGYRVEIPDTDEIVLWRWMSGPEVTPQQFMSRYEAKKRPRMWPEAKEDVLIYRAISAWDSEAKAIEEALAANGHFVKQGRSPKWTHVVEFPVDGHLGHAYAEEGAAHHFEVWAEPADLASKAGTPVPIPA